MKRYASIDIGTNSVLLLVVERGAEGRFDAILERAEITRLGREVDRKHRLSSEGIKDTLEVLERYRQESRALGVEDCVVSATSAARDASNGAEFLRAAQERIGVEVQLLSGEQEASLAFSSVFEDFGSRHPDSALVMIDVGGGSTELVFGDAQHPGAISFRHSYDVGSVRLTERFITTDPVVPTERQALITHLRQTFAHLPKPPARICPVGVAGTVTTLYALEHRIDPYDASQVHRGKLTLAELRSLSKRLWDMPLAQRRALPGLQPKRADVICAGAAILELALEQLGASDCLVSDRGLRWGLLLHAFGAR